MAKDLISESRRLRHTTNLLGPSAYEYVAARCLDINHFTWQALPLFVIAIEKALKAIICEKDQTLSPKSMNHNLVKLFKQVNQYEDYDLARFESYIPKLEQMYNIRYHDNQQNGDGLTILSEDFDMIDEIYIELADQIQIMPEIKFRCGLFSIIFDEHDRFSEIKNWAYKNNKALAKILPKWQKIHEEYLVKRGR